MQICFFPAGTAFFFETLAAIIFSEQGYFRVVLHARGVNIKKKF